MNESIASDIEAKQRSINAMIASQMQGSSASGQNSMLGQAAAQKVAGSKEAVLRKLLETQDNYIHELEAKCKAMSAQLLSDQGGSTTYLGGFNHNQSAL